MTVRAVLPALVVVLLLAAAAPAGAAPSVSVRVDPASGVRLGQELTIRGAVTDTGVALANRQVRLEVKRHPFKGRWRSRGTDRTDERGRYSFTRALDRNHDVRVRLVGLPATPGDGQYVPPTPAEQDTLSRTRSAYVLPAFTLDFEQRPGGRIRITQTYSVPRDARLTAKTRFYVGPCDLERSRCTARRAPLRAVAETERVRPGRYVATATVRIPRSFDGRFQYVSCFPYSPGSGMGNPKLRCPSKSARVR